MESSYFTQVHVQNSCEAALTNIIDISDPPLPGTVHDKYGVKNCIWPELELAKGERMTSPKFNPGPWQKWLRRLSQMGRVENIFDELHSIAREIPGKTIPINIVPRRWWKG